MAKGGTEEWKRKRAGKSEQGQDNKKRGTVLRYKLTCVCGTWAETIFSLSSFSVIYLFIRSAENLIQFPATSGGCIAWQRNTELPNSLYTVYPMEYFMPCLLRYEYLSFYLILVSYLKESVVFDSAALWKIQLCFSDKTPSSRRSTLYFIPEIFLRVRKEFFIRRTRTTYEFNVFKDQEKWYDTQEMVLPFPSKHRRRQLLVYLTITTRMKTRISLREHLVPCNFKLTKATISLGYYHASAMQASTFNANVNSVRRRNTNCEENKSLIKNPLLSP